MIGLAPMRCKALTSTKLSPIESAFLRSRLDGVSAVIRDKYKELPFAFETGSIDTLIFPGAGGVDPLVEELCSSMPSSKIIDWSEHRGTIFTAAYDGEAVGGAIANLLLENEKTIGHGKIHCIGISVGAFCANAAATAVYQRLGKTVCVRLTLLDPFCGRGVFGGSYGKKHFGKFATTALQILNSDDPVPTTNEPLPFCYCIDVTRASERGTFVPLPGDSMHSWPVAFFARHFQEPSGPLQRGMVVKV